MRLYFQFQLVHTTLSQHNYFTHFFYKNKLIDLLWMYQTKYIINLLLILLIV